MTTIQAVVVADAVAFLLVGCGSSSPLVPTTTSVLNNHGYLNLAILAPATG